MSKPLDISPENWKNLQTRDGQEIVFIKQDADFPPTSVSALVYVSKASNGGLHVGKVGLTGRSYPVMGENRSDVIEKPKLLLTEQDVGKRVRLGDRSTRLITAYNPAERQPIICAGSQYWTTGEYRLDKQQMSTDIIELLD